MQGNRIKPSLREEYRLWRRGFRFICGLDEAGRGPLAGPVVAGAVIVKIPSTKHQNPNKIQNTKSQTINNKRNLEIKILMNIVKDSKQLTEKQREVAYEKLTKSELIDFGVGIVSEKIIDKINIKNASEYAMCLAVNKLKRKPDYLLIDGSDLKNKELLKYDYNLIVKGDEKIFSIAAASIIAKVTRDRIMKKYDQKYPDYGFGIHKGYPSKFHLAVLKKLGPVKIHRQSFGPVKKIVDAT